MTKKHLLLSLLSALLYVLATPPVALSLLGWVCLAPLIAAAVEAGTSRLAFKYGFIAGLAASLGLYYWLVFTMHTFGGLAYPLSFLLFLLLAAFLALYWAFFACFAHLFYKKGYWLSLLLPLLWVAMEYLRGWLFTGFPWALLGYTQHGSPYVIQLAEFVGVYGVSALLVLVSVLVYRMWLGFRSSGRFPLKEMVIILLLVTADVGYGFFKVGSFEPKGRPLKVALVQGNISQGQKWQEGFQSETLDIYHRLSEEALREAGRLDLIVWPETAAPFYFQEPGALTTKLLDLTAALDSPLLFGSPAYRMRGRGFTYLNSAYLIAPSGSGAVKTLGRYDKLHLVPFGEYVPLKSVLFFVSKLTEGVGDFSAGEGVKSLVVKTPSGDVALGPLICYEGIFPGLVRQFVKGGADVLVNITNDGWYGRTSAPYQHLSAVIFRAVENGVYLLRAANTGITAIVDPLGRVVKASDLFVEAQLNGEVYISGKKTVYTGFGDIFAITAFVISLLAIISCFYSKIGGKAKGVSK
ncbi:MAG: apolipoprotein N-acyltransferase [Proteobacteria bacterium]|nr:apolipoprotein N-acyltransferase [Pseudomonadota bacterium]